MLRITLTKEGESPQVSTFDKREITIGRTTANDLVINEPGVSSAHARILFTGDEVTLIDLESTNGTFVNGERIRGPALVQPGDEVYICAYSFDFELGGSSPQAAGPSFDGPPPAIGQPPPSLSDGPPPMAGGPEYPTPADLGPPPLGRSSGPNPPAGGSTGDPGPPLLGAPPPSVSPAPVEAPPAPVESPPAPLAAAPAPLESPPAPLAAAPAPLESPPAPLESPPAPLESPPPLEAPPAPLDTPAPVEPPPAESAPAPLGDLPPPLTPSATATPPAPAAAPPPAADTSSAPSSVAGPISASETPPPVAPPTPSPVAEAPALGVAPAPIAGVEVEARAPAPAPIAGPTIVAEPTPTPASVISPFAPAAVPGPVVSAAPPRAAPNDDLSDLKGPNAVAEACARVFALVHYSLAPDGSLPPGNGDTRARARMEALRLLTEVAQRVPEIQSRPWSNRLANELCGLGALSAPLADPDVIDVFVHGPDRILVHREGETPSPSNSKFSCPAAIEVVVRRLTGRPFGPETPIVEARTSDGAEVRAVHDSTTSPGPLVTIHRDRVDGEARGLESLLQLRSLPSGVATLLHHCVQAGLNILVCGGPGANTFPWLAALTAEAPAEDRHVVVRPGPEPDPLPANAMVVHTNSLLPARGLSSAQRAMRAALSLAPDRLVVQDVTGAEAADLVAAMGGRLLGTLVSVRAASADGGLARLATLAGLGGQAPDAAAMSRHVAQSVEVVVAISRFSDGQTRLTELAEATVSSDGTAQTVSLVAYQPNSGQWAPSGVAPSFFTELQRRGIAVDIGLLSD